jgi:hypothetical protein
VIQIQNSQLKLENNMKGSMKKKDVRMKMRKVKETDQIQKIVGIIKYHKKSVNLIVIIHQVQIEKKEGRYQILVLEEVQKKIS